MLVQTSMIDQFAAMPMGEVRKILKSNMAKKNIQGPVEQRGKPRRKVKKGFTRSSFPQIVRCVEIAIPLVFEGVSNSKIKAATRRETGREIDDAIIKRLRAGSYSHRDNHWVLDFASKTFTGPGSTQTNQPCAAKQEPIGDAANKGDAATILKRFLKELEASCGLTDVRIDADGKMRATKSSTVIIDI